MENGLDALPVAGILAVVLPFFLLSLVVFSPAVRIYFYSWRGNREAVIKIYEKMLQHNPQKANLYTLLADLYLLQRRDDEAALKVYETVLLLNLPTRNREALHLLLAEKYIEQGRRDPEAIAVLEKALAIEQRQQNQAGERRQLGWKPADTLVPTTEDAKSNMPPAANLSPEQADAPASNIAVCSPAMSEAVWPFWSFVTHETRQQIEETLAALLKKDDDISKVALLSPNGQILFEQSVSEQTLATVADSHDASLAIAAALMHLKRATENLSTLGELNEINLQSAYRSLLVMQTGNQSGLVTVARSGEHLGMILLEAREAARSIQKLMPTNIPLVT